MNQSPRRRWLFASATMVFLAVIQRGAGLVLMIFLARFFDSRGLGAYAFTQSTSQTFYGFARLGADLGLQVSLASLDPKREREKVEQLLSQALSIFFGIALTVGSAMALLASIIARQLFDATELTPFVTAAAVLFVGQVFSQYAYSVFSGLNAFSIYSRLNLVSSIGTVMLVVSGGYWRGPLGASWCLAVAQMVTIIYMAKRLMQLFEVFGIRVQLQWPTGPAAKILKIGFPFYAGGLFIIPVDFMNLSLLSRSLGVSAMGDLRVTQALMSIASFLPTAIAGPALTFLAERHAAGDGNGSFLIQLKVVWLLIISVSIGLAAVWPFAVHAIFGEGFELARTVGVLSVIGLMPTMILSVLHGGIMARRRTNTLFFIGLLQALVLAVLGLTLIYRYGLAGFLVSQTVSVVVGVGLTYYRLCTEDPSLKPTRWMGLLFILTTVICALISLDVMIQPALIYRFIFIFIIISVFILVSLRFVISRDERLSIMKAIFAMTARLRSKII